MANRVVHFEIEAKDTKRAEEFYKNAFGWDMQPQGKEYGGYVVVVTGENTGKMEDNGINGGIYAKQGDKKEVNAYRCVISVDDINRTIEDVKKAGGKVLNTPQDIPHVGLFVSCIDTEDNHFTLLQPSMDSMQQEKTK